jgi:autotransporter-associated beta strand protein
LDLARDGSPAIGTGGAGSNGGSHGLVVNSNAVAKITGSSGNQITQGAGGNSYVEVILNTGVLDLNGHDEAVDMISMTNGVLRNSAAGTIARLTILGTAGAHPTNAVTLTGANCELDVPPSDALLAVASIVNGNGTLVKTGLGNVILEQSNSYTGNITVNAGTLGLSYPDIAPAATVTVATNAMLSLNFANSETNAVGSLVLNGAYAAVGVHNATTDPTYINGSGSLLVLNQLNQNPGTIQFSLSGGVLSLAWPTNGGWKLQTNSVSVVNPAAWFDFPGSTAVTSTNIPLDTTSTSVFFRLVKP